MKIDNQIDVLASLGIPSLPSQSPNTIAALLWAREVLQKHQTMSYAVQDPKGIEELTAVTIGGVDQWLHIRGRNRDNPVLLHLHGGPGAPMIGYMDAIQRPWEDYFTVVNWDQRQTGKSYFPADDENAPLSIDQSINDTKEVIQYLLDHLQQDKLFILGCSWGTVLGMHMVKRHPEWLYAYIAVGQVVNQTESDRIAYERLLDHAREQSNNEVIAHLESMAPYPDPNNPEQSFIDHGAYIRSMLSDLAGEAMLHHSTFEDALTILHFNKAISPHLSLTDLSNATVGDTMALYRDLSFAKEFMEIDLPEQVGNTFDVPIFFFTGAHDWHSPRVLSDDWFKRISAPHKELVHFEESAHGVLGEEPGKFLIALVNKVLPFAKNALGKQVSR